METQNLGLVKALFRQATSPVRTDVWWFDTTTNQLKYWDAFIFKWRAVSAYTQVVLPYAETGTNDVKIEIGSISNIAAIVINYAAVRGGKRIAGTASCVFNEDISTFSVSLNEIGDVYGVTDLGLGFSIIIENDTYYFVITVDDSAAVDVLFVYTFDIRFIDGLPIIS